MAVGAMLGFLIPTFVADYTPKPTVEARVPESPVARDFIDAYVGNDKAELQALGVSSADQLQSARFRAEFEKVDHPVHLGSWVGGGFTLHAYAAHVIRADGTPDLLSWRVVTSGGQVTIVDPPSQQQKP